MIQAAPKQLDPRQGVFTTYAAGTPREAMDFAETKSEADEVMELGGVSLLIDPMALIYLVGTEMDFVEEKLGSNFVFRNPNESGRCGCGESFSV